MGVLNRFDPAKHPKSPVLAAALDHEGAGWARGEVSAFGAATGAAEVIRWGFEANENPPVLHTHDRFGQRRDEVAFHPAYHQLTFEFSESI